LNNQSWDIQSAGKTKNMQIWSTNSQWFQLFKYEGSYFVNFRNNNVIEAEGNKDLEGQAVKIGGRNGGKNQQW
jgi:hypothetical protein